MLYKANDFYSNFNYIHDYDSNNKLKFFLEKREEFETNNTDTLLKIYYGDNGQKSFEIKNNSLKTVFIYENNLLIKQIETLIDERDSFYMAQTNFYYDNNKIIRKEYWKTFTGQLAKDYEISYSYEKNKMIGYKNRFSVYGFIYENEVVSKIKMNEKYFDVDYIFYE